MWTLQYNSTTKSFADWGLVGVGLEYTSFGVDKLTFTQDGAQVDSNTTFPYGAILKMYRDGTKWFEGKVTKTPRSGNPSGESIKYEVSGAGWYLENLVFQQVFKVFQGYTTPGDPSTDPILAEYKTSHVWLNKYNLQTGVRILSDEQLREILQWAIDNGAPFQIGTIGVSTDVLTEERRDVTCMEAIKMECRWAPDAVQWFDYSTIPPTINIGRRDDLEVVEISPLDGLDVSTMEAVPREELQLDLVLLRYEVRNNIEGTEVITIVQDKCDATGENNPETPDVAFGALLATIDMRGVQQPGQSVQIETSLIPYFPLNPNGDPAEQGLDSPVGQWAKRLFPALLDDPTLDTTKVKVSFEPRNPVDDEDEPIDPNVVPFALEDGQIAPWMEALSVKETIVGTVLVGHVNKQSNTQQVTKAITVTDLPSGKYRDTSQDEMAEPIPQHLARDIYNAAKQLQYDGSVTITEEECMMRVVMGNTLNLVGTNQSTLAEMKAMVVSISYDIDNGTTTVSYGPKHNLGASDLVELLRMARSRRILNPISIAGGSNLPQNSVELGDKVAKHDAQKGDPWHNVQSVTSVADPDAAILANPDTEESGRIIHEVKGKDGDGYSIPKKVQSTWSAHPDKDGKVQIDLDKTKVTTKDGTEKPLAVELKPCGVCVQGTRMKAVVLISENYV